MTDHLRLLYKINDPAVIHLLCLIRQIFFVINKPDIYFTSIAYWLIFLWVFLSISRSLWIFCTWILQNAGRSWRREEISKDTGQNCFHFILFRKLAKKKKHPLKYELPSIPPKKVESNDSVNSYLVPYWNKNLTCR